MNILDYLEWRGDLLFTERPFNEVDNLILSSLAYLELEGIISNDGETKNLPMILDYYNAAGYDQSDLVNDPRPLLEKIVSAPRFQKLQVGRYVSMTDADVGIQFAAMTFFLDDGTAYVAYRGTDTSVVGWREDFNFALMRETPGQSESVDYLNYIGENTTGPLIVGGHSKGGNFAVYASLFCSDAVKERIQTVYSNDGPGFMESIANSENYRMMISRIQKIIPENSLIGILLTGYEKKRVIKSSAKGILQHNPYTWDIRVTQFDPADERSDVSMFMDETLSRWIDSLSTNEKRTLISAIFDSLEDSGIDTLSAVKEHNLLTFGTIMDVIKNMDPDTSRSAFDSLGKLFSAGRDVLLKGFKDKFDELGAFLMSFGKKETEEEASADLMQDAEPEAAISESADTPQTEVSEEIPVMPETAPAVPKAEESLLNETLPGETDAEPAPSVPELPEAALPSPAMA